MFSKRCYLLSSLLCVKFFSANVTLRTSFSRVRSLIRFVTKLNSLSAKVIPCLGVTYASEVHTHVLNQWKPMQLDAELSQQEIVAPWSYYEWTKTVFLTCCYCSTSIATLLSCSHHLCKSSQILIFQLHCLIIPRNSFELLSSAPIKKYSNNFTLVKTTSVILVYSQKLYMSFSTDNVHLIYSPCIG